MVERGRGASLSQGFLDFSGVARYQPAYMTVNEPDIPAPAGTGEPLNDEDKVLVVFCYLGPLAIVAFLAARREYVRWHARQGLVFFLVAFGVILVMSMLEALAGSIHWFLGKTTSLFGGVVYLCLFGVTLLCILKALKGERWRLPFVRELADRL
ncbi:MAG: DUF4870 domain-containing protein [Acidobacteria bacterium]|nr:MAG: DUF4870 domain-containing protein [Acidobacteriota bacterium]